MQTNIRAFEDTMFVIDHIDSSADVYFNDLLTNKFGNYVVQTSF